MTPIIGIIMRSGKSENNHNIEYVYTDIETSIIKSGGVPIGIKKNEIKKYLDICNGFILQGGSEFDLSDFENIKTIKDNDKPLLGLCLGMQEMAYLAGGSIKDINKHLNTNHDIIIKKDSLLYNILKKERISVNSRHKSAIVKTNLQVSGYSPDGIIEAVEDKNNKFYLGLEWHPENLYDESIDTQKIFDYFIKICQDNK